MKINNTTLPTKVKLKDRIIYTSTYNSITDWYDEALDGVLLNQLRDFRTIQLKFLIDTDNEDEAYKETSKLVDNLKESTIRFDDIDLDFQCYVHGSFQPTRVQNGKFLVTIELKNAIAKGTEVTQNFAITKKVGKLLTINYYVNWAPTVAYYTAAFEDSDLHELIATEKQYVSTETITAKDFDEYFSKRGVDLNKYKPAYGTLSGQVQHSDDFSLATAQSMTTIDIYYNKKQVDKFEDIPGGKNYPSVTWRSVSGNAYKFILPIADAYKKSNLSVEVIGRWYDLDLSTSGDASTRQTLFDHNGDKSNQMSVYQQKLNWGPSGTAQEANVFTNSASQGKVIITTYESIAHVPMRKVGWLDIGNDRSEIEFNGTYIDVTDKTLTGGTQITIGANRMFDLCRVTIWAGPKETGTKLYDLIPIDGSVKNCFVNNFDDGLYDIDTMTFYPWTDGTSTGAAPTSPMAKPGEIPTPEPSIPTDPSVLWLYKSLDDINNDDYSGALAKHKSNTTTQTTQQMRLSAIDQTQFYVVQPVPNFSFGGWTYDNTSAISFVSEGQDNKGRWYAVCKAAKSGNVHVQQYQGSNQDDIVASIYLKITSY